MTKYHIRAQVFSLVESIILLLVGIACLPVAMLSLIKNGRFIDIFNAGKLSEANFTWVWRLIGKPRGDETRTSAATIGQAYGVVLDLGPGTGHTVGYLDKSKITRVFGIEPNKNFHAELQAAIDKSGLTDIYTIVGTGVEDTETLRKYGIEEDSMDSIVACKVLCSVPRPKETIAQLYKYLAPGGQMLVFEHVKAKSGFGMRVQDLINTIWPFLLAGCNIGRPTEAYLYGAGDWDEKALSPAEGMYGVEVITFTQGRLVKAKK